MIDMDDDEAVIRMYDVAEIVGLSLPEPAIRKQAGVIAKGLVRRFERRGRELTILIVLNKVGGAEFVRRQVQAHLAQQVSPELCAKILANTHFAETVVSRIVSKITNDALVRQLRIKSTIFQNSLTELPFSPLYLVASVCVLGASIWLLLFEIGRASCRERV